LPDPIKKMLKTGKIIMAFAGLVFQKPFQTGRAIA